MKELLQNKRFLAVYGLWIFLHTALLLSGDHDGYSRRHFWPFANGSFTDVYDLSEWFVYVLTPLLLIVIVKAFVDTPKP